MKAALVVEKNRVAIKDIECPAIGRGEVLIKTAISGVCGSDLHLFHGTHAFRNPPAVLGHEIAGEIIEIGNDVKNFAIGDRVTVEPHVGCKECEFCKQGHINICNSKKVPGTPNWVGTFVEYFNAPETSLHKLADSVSYETGVLAEPLAVALHCMNKVSVKEKDCIVILGAGAIGLLTLVVAREMGYKTIITTDTAPFNREMSIKLGAKAAVDPFAENVATRVAELSGGRGADLAIVSTGADNILDQACEIVRKRGEIGIVSMITSKIPFYSYAVVLKEQTVFGSMTYEPKDFVQAMNMINGGLAIGELVSQKFAIDDTQKAMEALSEVNKNVVKVVVSL